MGTVFCILVDSWIILKVFSRIKNLDNYGSSPVIYDGTRCAVCFVGGVLQLLYLIYFPTCWVKVECRSIGADSSMCRLAETVAEGLREQTCGKLSHCNRVSKQQCWSAFWELRCLHLKKPARKHDVWQLPLLRARMGEQQPICSTVDQLRINIFFSYI